MKILSQNWLSTQLTGQLAQIFAVEILKLPTIFVFDNNNYKKSDATTNYYDDNSLRLTTGAGLLWQSPFGPIRLDYSFAILKESYDKTETFSFNVGTLF